MESLEKARSDRAMQMIRGLKPSGNQFTTGASVGHTELTKKKIGRASAGRKHTPEACRKISEARIKWLRANPDKHPWKHRDKFTSPPCEQLKDRLRQAGLEFEEEYEPFEKRFFALDIAFPDLKVAVEVNGNQHYDDPQTGKLQRYYQNRHDLLVEAGWRVLEIHYAFSFQEKAVDQVINAIRLRSSVGQ